jgi:acyl-CoA thioesterase-2
MIHRAQTQSKRAHYRRRFRQKSIVELHARIARRRVQHSFRHTSVAHGHEQSGVHFLKTGQVLKRRQLSKQTHVVHGLTRAERDQHSAAHVCGQRIAPRRILLLRDLCCALGRPNQQSDHHQYVTHSHLAGSPFSMHAHVIITAAPTIATMTYDINDLLSLLDLEPIEFNIYRGTNRDIGSGRVFGGQVLAQALVAAQRTVPEERRAHSLHGYFILPGDLEVPIVYFVDRLRDGKSFATRRVTAIQHGRAIFNMAVSFHDQEAGLEHQQAMPDVPPPESLVSELDIIRARSQDLPEPLREVITQDRPIDFRMVEDIDPFDPEKQPPLRHMWMRANGRMPDGPLAHQAVLAYASDYGLLGTALQPHGRSYRRPNIQVASLDHSLWLHRPCRLDEWLLYVIDSPIAAGARGFARGTIFTRAGQLVASVAQEGLTRPRDIDPKS